MRTSPLSSPIRKNCRCIKRFLIGGWSRVLPEVAGISNPRRLTINQWSRRLHTARGAIDPGDHCFSPRFVWVADLWKEFRSGHGTLFAPDVARFMNPSRSAISQWGRTFPTLRGVIVPADHRVCIRFVGVVDVWKYL